MQIQRSGRAPDRARGFTLIEAMVVMLFVGIMVAIGLPALQQMINRSRLEGAARECSVVCQRARLEAIKLGVPLVVRFDTTEKLVVAWVDDNLDEIQDPDEQVLVSQGLAGTVDFGGPPGYNPIEGFSTDTDGGWAVFCTDGSVDLEGEVYFRDTRGNFLQMSVSPRATANISLRKWDGTEWVVPGEEGKPWKWK